MNGSRNLVVSVSESELQPILAAMVAAERPVVEPCEAAAAVAGDDVPEASYQWELEHAPAASPFAGPTWISSQRRDDDHGDPCRYIANRLRGDVAVLPVQVINSPASPDEDPRSYFGWKPATGPQACYCGPPQRTADGCHDSCGEPDQATDLLDVVGHELLFPVLVLGSLTGYQSEILHPDPAPDVADAMLDAALRYARRAGARTLLAPWVPDRGGGPSLAHVLAARGAVRAFWALEDYMLAPHESMASHVVGMRRRDRLRYHQDQRAADQHDVQIRTASGQDLGPHLQACSALVAANKRRYGLAAPLDEVTQTVLRLEQAGFPVVANLGFAGARLVACSISLRKRDRLYGKYVGFDYDTVGTRSGLYAPVAIWATLAAAYQTGCSAVEFGVGSHQAKIIRGCLSRPIASYLLAEDAYVREMFQQAALASRSGCAAEY
jgi:hypothetical protein